MSYRAVYVAMVAEETLGFVTQAPVGRDVMSMSDLAMDLTHSVKTLV